MERSAAAKTTAASLTDDERDRLLWGYENGCQGDIIIGLCGNERITTMLLPVWPDEDRQDEQMSLVAQKLRQIGCDGFVHVYLKQVNENERKFEMMVDQDFL